MIVTVTPNPAYDVTYDLDVLTPGEVNRVASVHRRPGGKGVNVASVLQQLGAPVVATGFASADFAREVAGLGIDEAFLRLLASVRNTLAVVESEPVRTTSLWEPGPALADPSGATDQLVARVTDLLSPSDCLVVSGSLPPGVPPDLPAQLAQRALEIGCPAIVDCSGEALRLAARVPGVVVMPNSDELDDLAGDLDPAAAVRRLLDGGAGAVYATRGHRGLLLGTPAGLHHVPVPREVTGNPTGAGDAAAAAVARVLAAGGTHVEAALDAVALAATAVASPYAGTVDPALFAELRALTQAHPVDPEEHP